ncbi:MAG TPA: hypothetical protein VL092_13820 [Chitinophagaceae bacterium]|nr:hypothetical protein [Chitinophagaceae bacterium]
MPIVEAYRKEKILYYFGAGASAKALPLARSVWSDKMPAGMPGLGVENKVMPEIKGLAYELDNFLNGGIAVSNDTIKSGSKFDKLRDECKQLAQKADEFGDVDTYAKFLHLKNPGGKELNRLKHLLSCYFSIKQTAHNAKDSRYIPWLVGIMNENAFPANVKILSWNYDSQIQIAAKMFNEHEDAYYDVDSFDIRVPLIPDISTRPTLRKTNKFSLIQLNGRAGCTDFRTANKQSVFYKRNCKDFHSVINFLHEEDHAAALHFAWENDGFHNDLMNDVLKMVTDVTIVVVIGYSFPFYNREVDKRIFNQILAGQKLHKIYYQDPRLNGQQLKAQFGLKEDINIVHIDQTDNFHIPFEY